MFHIPQPRPYPSDGPCVQYRAIRHFTPLARLPTTHPCQPTFPNGPMPPNLIPKIDELGFY